MLRMRANNLDHEFVVVCKLIKSRKLVACTSSTASRSGWQQLKLRLTIDTAFAKSHKRITRFCGTVDCSFLPRNFTPVSQMLQVRAVNSWFEYTCVSTHLCVPRAVTWPLLSACYVDNSNTKVRATLAIVVTI